MSQATVAHLPLAKPKRARKRRKTKDEIQVELDVALAELAKLHECSRMRTAVGAGIPTLLLAVGAGARGAGTGGGMGRGCVGWAAGRYVSLPHVRHGLETLGMRRSEAWALAAALDAGWAMAEVALRFGDLAPASRWASYVVLALGWLGSTALNVRSFSRGES